MLFKVYTRLATENIYGFYCSISCISSFEAKISCGIVHIIALS